MELESKPGSQAQFSTGAYEYPGNLYLFSYYKSILSSTTNRGIWSEMNITNMNKNVIV